MHSTAENLQQCREVYLFPKHPPYEHASSLLAMPALVMMLVGLATTGSLVTRWIL